MAQHLCGKLLDGRDLPDETRHWILMALREGLANAIKHGNRLNLGKRVHVELNVTGETLEMKIRDEGEGFEAETVGDPLAPENRLKTSGRGIFYMKTFMDDVRFRRVDGGGMEITLTKKLGAADKEEGRKP